MFARPIIALLAILTLGACTTARVEDAREGVTGIREGESVVIMAKSYHLGNETEAKYIRCIENALGRGREGLRVIPNGEFVDSLFPWFEPRTAPAETKNLAKLMERPGVAERIAEQGVRYIIWLRRWLLRFRVVAERRRLRCIRLGSGGSGVGRNRLNRRQRHLVPAGAGYTDSVYCTHAFESLQDTGGSTPRLHRRRRDGLIAAY
jgi:hypothetical protein